MRIFPCEAIVGEEVRNIYEDIIETPFRVSASSGGGEVEQKFNMLGFSRVPRLL